MFWKKTCKNCGKKLEKDFSYCPFCGYSHDKEKEQKDYGFLGKKDIDEPDFFKEGGMKLPMGFNFLFKNLMKEMDKQFRELDRQIGRERREIKTHPEKLGELEKSEKIKRFPVQGGGLSINISNSAGKPIIRVKSFGNIPEFKEMENELKGPAKKRKKHTPEITEEKAKKLSKLPRKEAESKVRRLSGKVIYEIELPGVKSIKDIVINELENSIEIKAFTKDQAYFKFLPISLPLLNHEFSKGKLILELGEDKKQ